jgi:DNA replicative helicase MCM subunit Mcm2 (Cdc46/Mcm family)
MVQTVYDQVADFIAELNPTKVLELKASEEMRLRLTFLLEKEQETELIRSEKYELDHYLVLERLIRLSKAHARLRLAA